MRGTALATALLGVVGGVAGLAGVAAAHEPRPSHYSWHRDVRPILARHCVPCHTAGGPGPMSLERFEEVQPWAAAIQREVLERRMPPWAPEEGHAPLAGARLLSAREIDVIADWVSGATPEGDPAPPPPAAPPAPELADAALRLRLPEERLGPDQPERNVCRSVELPLAQPAGLTGLELRPGQPRALRRVMIWRGRDCDEAVPPLEVWVPGQPPLELPEGHGLPLEPGDALALRLEYLKTWDQDGLELIDRSELRLRLGSARDPVRRLAVAGETVLADPATLLAVAAATADPGTALRLVARLPGGENRLLLELRDPDPLWLGRYAFLEPLRLPAGTALRVSGGTVFVERLPPP